MTHPTDEILCMQSVVPRKNQQDPENAFKVKFEKINTNQLSKITKAYRSGEDQQTILITKEIRNFESGGHLLACYYKAKSEPILMEVRVGSHVNFQIPQDDDAFDPDMLYRFKLRKIKPNSKDKELS